MILTKSQSFALSCNTCKKFLSVTLFIGLSFSATTVLCSGLKCCPVFDLILFMDFRQIWSVKNFICVRYQSRPTPFFPWKKSAKKFSTWVTQWHRQDFVTWGEVRYGSLLSPP